MALAIGVDIGGTKVAFGIVSRDGTVDHRRSFPTPGSGTEIVELLIRECAELLGIAARDGVAGRDGVARRDGVAGVGVGTGGVVDSRRGSIVHASDLIKEWAGTRLADRLSAALGLPAYVDNDGNTFALAESWFGAGRDADDALYVAVGTGVGGGMTLRGELRQGPRNLAGELGHLTYPTHRRCSCGLPGHVEAVASGPSLTAIYRERSGSHVETLEEVVARANGGEALARSVLDDGARSLGRALSGVLLALDLPVLVLGGGVGLGLGARYLQGVRNAILTELPYSCGVDVRPAMLGSTASVAGAGALALRASLQTL
jgi:glucokinase